MDDGECPIQTLVKLMLESGAERDVPGMEILIECDRTFVCSHPSFAPWLASAALTCDGGARPTPACLFLARSVMCPPRQPDPLNAVTDALRETSNLSVGNERSRRLLLLVAVRSLTAFLTDSATPAADVFRTRQTERVRRAESRRPSVSHPLRRSNCKGTELWRLRSNRFAPAIFASCKLTAAGINR